MRGALGTMGACAAVAALGLFSVFGAGIAGVLPETDPPVTATGVTDFPGGLSVSFSDGVELTCRDWVTTGAECNPDALIAIRTDI